MASESLPMDKLKRLQWLPTLRQSEAFTVGGSGAAIDYGEPYITITAQYENLTDAQMRVLSAFLARRNGRAVPFRAHNPARKKPIAIANPAALSPTISEVSTGVLQIDTGVSDQMSEGDIIAYKSFTGARFVGQISDIVASSGTTTDFMTQPAAQQPDGTPELQIFEAEGLFRLDPSSVDMSEPHDLKRRVSFTARQLETPFVEP